MPKRFKSLGKVLLVKVTLMTKLLNGKILMLRRMLMTRILMLRILITRKALLAIMFY